MGQVDVHLRLTAARTSGLVSSRTVRASEGVAEEGERAADWARCTFIATFISPRSLAWDGCRPLETGFNVITRQPDLLEAIEHQSATAIQ
jgi:hypothetical protein